MGWVLRTTLRREPTCAGKSWHMHSASSVGRPTRISRFVDHMMGEVRVWERRMANSFGGVAASRGKETPQVYVEACSMCRRRDLHQLWFVTQICRDDGPSWPEFSRFRLNLRRFVFGTCLPGLAAEVCPSLIFGNTPRVGLPQSGCLRPADSRSGDEQHGQQRPFSCRTNRRSPREQAFV